MAWLLLAVKIAGTSLAAIFGLIGTFSKFLAEDGRVTRIGKIAVVGLSLSVLLTFVADIWSGVLAQRESVASTLRTEAMVRDLDRSLRQIESVSFFVVDFRPPADDPLIAAYFRRVDAMLAPVIVGFRDGTWTSMRRPEADGVDYSLRAFDEADVPVTAELLEPLLPDPQSVLNAALTVGGATLSIYAAGVPEADILAGAARPNLRIEMGYGQPPLPVNYELDDAGPDPKPARLIVSGAFDDPGKPAWTGDETIVATPDLRGATIAVHLGPFGMADAAEDAAFQALRARSELREAALRVNASDIHFAGDQIRRAVDQDGSTMWLMRLGTADPLAPG